MRLALFLLVVTLPGLAQKTHEFCASCHSEQVADFQTHPHFQKGLSCDACHGASVKHRTSTGAVPPDRVAAPDEVPALCGGCHGAEQKEYLASAHGKLVVSRSKTKAANCATCHGVHNLRNAKQTQLQCGRCHAMLAASHPAVTAGASCMSCHAKHTLVAAVKSR
jgi:Cytochrome c3